MGFPTIGILNTPIGMYVFEQPQNPGFGLKSEIYFQGCGVTAVNATDLLGDRWEVLESGYLTCAQGLEGGGESVG